MTDLANIIVASVSAETQYLGGGELVGPTIKHSPTDSPPDLKSEH